MSTKRLLALVMTVVMLLSLGLPVYAADVEEAGDPVEAVVEEVPVEEPAEEPVVEPAEEAEETPAEEPEAIVAEPEIAEPETVAEEAAAAAKVVAFIGENNYASLKAAAEAAVAGDTIVLCEFIELNDDIVLPSGVTFYASKYAITGGSGSITVKSDAVLQNSLNVIDFRGLENTNSLVTDYGVYPFTDYAVDQLNVKIIFESGAIEMVDYEGMVSGQFIGPDGLYRLGEGATLTQSIDADGNMIIDIAGDASIGDFVLDGALTVDAGRLPALPLGDGMELNITSGEVKLDGENLLLLSGSKLTVAEGAKLEINKDVYVGSGAALDVKGELAVSGGLYVESESVAPDMSKVTFNESAAVDPKTVKYSPFDAELTETRFFVPVDNTGDTMIVKLGTEDGDAEVELPAYNVGGKKIAILDSSFQDLANSVAVLANYTGETDSDYGKLLATKAAQLEMNNLVMSQFDMAQVAALFDLTGCDTAVVMLRMAVGTPTVEDGKITMDIHPEAIAYGVNIDLSVSDSAYVLKTNVTSLGTKDISNYQIGDVKVKLPVPDDWAEVNVEQGADPNKIVVNGLTPVNGYVTYNASHFCLVTITRTAEPELHAEAHAWTSAANSAKADAYLYANHDAKLVLTFGAVSLDEITVNGQTYKYIIRNRTESTDILKGHESDFHFNDFTVGGVITLRSAVAGFETVTGKNLPAEQKSQVDRLADDAEGPSYGLVEIRQGRAKVNATDSTGTKSADYTVYVNASHDKIVVNAKGVETDTEAVWSLLKSHVVSSVYNEEDALGILVNGSYIQVGGKQLTFHTDADVNNLVGDDMNGDWSTTNRAQLKEFAKDARDRINQHVVMEDASSALPAGTFGLVFLKAGSTIEYKGHAYTLKTDVTFTLTGVDAPANVDSILETVKGYYDANDRSGLKSYITSEGFDIAVEIAKSVINEDGVPTLNIKFASDDLASAQNAFVYTEGNVTAIERANTKDEWKTETQYFVLVGNKSRSVPVEYAGTITDLTFDSFGGENLAKLVAEQIAAASDPAKAAKVVISDGIDGPNVSGDTVTYTVAPNVTVLDESGATLVGPVDASAYLLATPTETFDFRFDVSDIAAEGDQVNATYPDASEDVIDVLAGAVVNVNGPFGTYVFEKIDFSAFEFRRSVALNDDLVMYAYLRGWPAGTERSEYTVEITVDANGDGTDEVETSSLADWTTANLGFYGHKIGEFLPRCMTNVATIKVYYAGNSTPVFEVETSIQDYCERALASSDITAKEKALLPYILNYGEYAQKRFNYKTDTLATANITNPTMSTDGLEAFAPVKPTAAFIDDVKFSVSLNAKTQMNFVFTPASGYSASDMTVTVKKDGAEYALATSSVSGDTLVVLIPGIFARNLGDTFDITVSCGGESATWQYAAVSYAQIVTDPSSTAYANNHEVATAFYNYYTAVKTYFA